ncbi:MAG: DUF1553 domain-containing protein [Planctomycetales bacterium]|nr:DUF1553 domain-containing protein [Planctomycetales bacterium]
MTWRVKLASVLLCQILFATLHAQDAPIASWDFGSEDAAPLSLHGLVHRDQAGPRPPEFPDFADDNTALRFVGDGYLSVQDPGPKSHFDFGNGDQITLEAWVKLEDARDGQLMYVIGKGRTDSPKFARDNQNWALRVVSVKDIAKISFLFATAPSSGGSHWHRWTSNNGFGTATGWHHIAVGYQFGSPDSLVAWIDGQSTAGVWDMGGATDAAPVVDDDAVWIGSSRAGSSANSFRGWIDKVAIHRSILPDNVIAARFNRVGGPRVVGPIPEVMPELDQIPGGRVAVTIAEGFPSNARWLNEGESWPQLTTSWLGNEFLLPRVPVRYDDWGIRIDWNAPLLVRMAADVQIPAGKSQILLRARSLSRLWIDGKVVARTIKNPHKRSNLEPIVPIADEPAPGVRIVKFPQQEVFGDVELDLENGDSAKTVRVVLELVVGGNGYRTESGEVCVAIQSPGDEMFYVLRPDGTSPLPLADPVVEPVLSQIEQSLVALEDETRRHAARSQDQYWEHRHQVATQWANAHPVHVDLGEAKSENPIDTFLHSKRRDAIAKAQEYDEKTTKHFHENVLPILRDHCFRCHGDKAQGGLKLNTRAAILLSGESEIPAVVPGDPDASELVSRIRNGDMPPTEDGLSSEAIETLVNWVRDGAVWPTPPIDADSIAIAAPIDDASFLRRSFLDTVGVPPTQQETEAFLASDAADKRQTLVNRLLDDERMADNWMSLWLDLLAENPTLLNPSLNSSGPFRWFLYDSLRDNKPIDRMVTELVLMRGGTHVGGSAGFALAAENDSPMAAKGHILASAFLGIELQCARCHDSPYHSTTQEDLYSLAAMLGRKSIAPPKTSRVPDAFFDEMERESLIRVTLPLGQSVSAKWPFAEATGIVDGDEITQLMKDPEDSRERLATLITAPGNQRFSRVIVNHVWKRLMGAGIVEPVHDWEGKQPSHPELLDWLATELITHRYDLRHVVGIIMTSQAYGRDAIGNNLQADAESRFFNAPDRRRLIAEQIVDSLFAATGCEIDVEELTFVHDGVHPIGNRLTLGKPRRAWMFASLTNERDRPSLSLPRAQPVVDVLEAFGWTGSRQKPIAQRESDPNVLQPGILANGTLTTSLTRASYQSELAELALNATSVDELVDALFLRFLCRYPVDAERQMFVHTLADGFNERILPPDQVQLPAIDKPLPQSTWTNHLLPEANEIQTEIQRRVRRGPAPDPRFRRHWRETYEDAVWSLVNHSEFVWIP